MNSFRALRALALLPLLALRLFADSTPPPPGPPPAPDLAGREVVLTVDAQSAANVSFQSKLPGSAQAAMEILALSATSHPVLRVTVPQPGPQHFSVEAGWRSQRSIAKGQPLLARFAARTLRAKQEAGEATFFFYFQQAASPWDKCITLQMSVGSDWQWFEIPFVAHRDYPAGEATANLSFAALAQSLEITPPEVFSFDPAVPLEALPRTRFTYEGREPDAAWRAVALARIETLRTAELRVRVVDSTGHPVPDARVEAALRTPEFYFGSEIDSHLVAQDSPQAEKYRSVFLENFDTAVIGNGLKWQRWINRRARGGVLWPREETLRALDWLDAQPGLRLKGHVLVWGGWNFTPELVRALPDREARLPDLLRAHITDILTATRGRLAVWDVLNEPLNEPDYLNLLGEEASAGWFKQARELAPEAALFINEYRMLAGGESRAYVEKYLDLVKRLRAHGAPIDGIGIQGHLGQQVMPPARVLADLDVLAAAGLPVHITEFDINTADEQFQADYTRDFLIACYSHPSVTGFFNWGFWEGSHWIPQAAMFRRDWTPKPNAAVWRELVLEKWRTRIDATTTPDGLVSARGHRGQYTVTATLGESVVTRAATLGTEGLDLTLILP
jgi:GH35 family endo-1,4-beta-xylanase